MLRASSLGSCLRCLVALEQGYTPVEAPVIVQGWYERGTLHEEVCVEQMRADGWTITDQQLSPEWLDLVLHLDGVCYSDGDPTTRRVLEVKAPNAWSRFEKAHKADDWSDPYMHRVAVQLSCYMLAMKMEAVVACVEDGRVKWFGVERPPFDQSYIEDRLEQIHEWILEGKLPPCSQKDWPCDTPYLCDYKGEPRAILDDPVLVSVVHEYTTTLRPAIQAGTAAEDKWKQLRVGLDVPVGRYEVDGVDVTVHTVAGRKYLDEDAMRADNVDVEKYRKQADERVQWKVT